MQRRLGNQPAFDDLEGFLAACASDIPVQLGAHPTRTTARKQPKASALRRLGERCTPPVSGPGASVLAALVSDPEQRWTREHAGLHLAVNRRSKPLDHHGIYLGDGSVVHFSGEGLAQREARVWRTSLSDFLGRDGIRRTRCLLPAKQSGERIATLDLSVICLRALSRLGETGYQLLANNCEHFSAWAQIGASVSFQTQRKYAGGKGRIHEAVAYALEQRLRLDRDPVPDGILLDGWDDAYPIDIARARWSPDREDVLIHFPLFDSTSQPVSGLHRPWTVGPLRVDADWHSAPPALELDTSWHASLITLGPNESYWLTSDGTWVRERCDPAKVIEDRLRNVDDLISALVAPPSREAQLLVNAAESVLRRDEHRDNSSG